MLCVVAVVLLSALTHSREPDSPIAWRSSDRPTATSPEDARRLAGRYLGRADIDAARHELVVLTDADAIGDSVGGRTVYLTLFEDVRLERTYENTPESIAIDIYVAVDATSGALVMAFTPARAEWAEPMYPRRSAAESVADAQWTISPPPARGMSSSVVDVLTAYYTQFGGKYVNAGQTILRPRWVATAFPAVRDGDDLIPTREAGPTWIVQTLGEILGSKYPPPIVNQAGAIAPAEPYYWTSMLGLVDDGSLDVCPCVTSW